MKLCTFLGDGGVARAGVVREGSVFDIAGAIEALMPELGEIPAADYSSVAGILSGGREALEFCRRLEEAVFRAGERTRELLLPESGIKLLAPVPRPNSIRDCLLFEEHMINSMERIARGIFPPAAWINAALRKTLGFSLLRPPRAWYRLPIYYKGNPDTVIGPGEKVIWPSYTKKLDYELEFGIYIMGRGKDIPSSRAGDLIGGYTIFNDFSARDIQMEEMSARLGPAKGKDFDTGNVMGPYLVTPDEVKDPYSLRMEALVNSELWSSGSSAGMRLTFEEAIAYISRSETLHAGDFIASGTVGTGCGLELDRWIKPGDTLTLKVENLGELSNPVVNDS